MLQGLERELVRHKPEHAGRTSPTAQATAECSPPGAARATGSPGEPPWASS